MSVALLPGLLAAGGEEQVANRHGSPILFTPHGRVCAGR